MEETNDKNVATPEMGWSAVENASQKHDLISYQTLETEEQTSVKSDASLIPPRDGMLEKGETTPLCKKGKTHIDSSKFAQTNYYVGRFHQLTNSYKQSSAAHQLFSLAEDGVDIFDKNVLAHVLTNISHQTWDYSYDRNNSVNNRGLTSHDTRRDIQINGNNGEATNADDLAFGSNWVYQGAVAFTNVSPNEVVVAVSAPIASTFRKMKLRIALDFWSSATMVDPGTTAYKLWTFQTWLSGIGTLEGLPPTLGTGGAMWMSFHEFWNNSPPILQPSQMLMFEKEWFVNDSSTTGKVGQSIYLHILSNKPLSVSSTIALVWHVELLSSAEHINLPPIPDTSVPVTVPTPVDVSGTVAISGTVNAVINNEPLWVQLYPQCECNECLSNLFTKLIGNKPNTECKVKSETIRSNSVKDSSLGCAHGEITGSDDQASLLTKKVRNRVSVPFTPENAKEFLTKEVKQKIIEAVPQTNELYDQVMVYLTQECHNVFSILQILDPVERAPSDVPKASAKNLSVFRNPTEAHSSAKPNTQKTLSKDELIQTAVQNNDSAIRRIASKGLFSASAKLIQRESDEKFSRKVMQEIRPRCKFETHCMKHCQKKNYTLNSIKDIIFHLSIVVNVPHLNDISNELLDPLSRSVIVCTHPRDQDGDFLTGVELNPGPSGSDDDTCPVEYNEVLELVDLPIEVETWLEKRLNNEKVILAEMRKLGFSGSSVDDANKMLVNSDPTLLNSLISTLSQAYGNRFIGPGFSGGSFDKNRSIRDLAEKLSVPASSKFDQIAKRHDLIYSISDDPTVLSKADEEMIGLIENVVKEDLVQEIEAKVLQSALKINQFIRPLWQSIPFNHNKSSDNNHLVGIESNPGPKIFDALMKLFKQYCSGTVPSSTIFGRELIMNSTTMNIMNSAIHDSMFTHITQTQITVDERAYNVDIPVEFFSAVPLTASNIAGAQVPIPQIVENVLWRPQTGKGPNCVNTDFTKNYDVLGTDLKEIVGIMRSQSALWPGNFTIQLWTMTKMLVSPGGENEKFSPNSGSNAWILSNLMLMLMTLDVNNAFFSIQKHINGAIMKPSTLIPTAFTLFPAHPFHQALIGCCNHDEFLAYVSGSGQLPAAQNNGGGVLVNWAQRLMFVFATDDMLVNNQSTRRALNLHILAHFPSPVWPYPDLAYRYKSGPNVGNVNGSWVARHHKMDWDLSGDPAFIVIVVRIPSTAAQGNFGAPSSTFQMQFGAATIITSTTNNPFRGIFAGVNQNLVNITPEIDLIFQTLQAPGASQNAFPEASRYWATQYGAKSEVVNAYIMSAMKLGMNTMSPYTNDGESYGVADVVGETTAPDVNVNPLAEMFLHKFDCFNRRIDSSNIYCFSYMEPVLRFALATKLRIPADISNRIPTTSIAAFNSTAMFCHCRDLFTAISGFTELSYVATGMTWDQALGLNSNVQTLNDQTLDYSVDLLDNLFDEVGFSDDESAHIWSLPSSARLITGRGSEIAEAQMVVFLVDKAWQGFKDVYKLTAETTIRVWPSEATTSRKLFPVANGVIPPAFISARMTLDKLNVEDVYKFQQPTVTNTWLGAAAAGHPTFIVASPQTGVATRLSNPLVMPSMNEWRSKYIGSIASYDITIPMTGPLLKTAIEAPYAPIYSWDTNEVTHYAWTADSDGFVFSSASNFNAYKVCSVPQPGSLYPSVLNNREQVSMKKKPLDKK
jgi:hypothetical protein